MKFALHQPYFFPYIGYFTIINGVDIYVHSDTMQYIRHGWINRNRILCNNGDWKYILVPIQKTKYSEPINKIKIDYSKAWEERILAQLANYKNYAPYYHNVVDIVQRLFNTKYNNIAELNIKSCDLVLEYLGIKKKIYKLSDLPIERNLIHEPDDWGLNVSKYFKDVDCYWNAPGGKELYSIKKYKDNGIDIKLVETQFIQYQQLNNQSFIPGLSILDVMMFNSEKEIFNMLNHYKYI